MKKGIAALLCVFMITAGGITAQAQESEQQAPETPVIQDGNVEITPFADVIVNKYRNHNGLLQMRRWNETRGYWVDPYWITISM